MDANTNVDDQLTAENASEVDSGCTNFKVIHLLWIEMRFEQNGLNVCQSPNIHSNYNFPR